MTRCRALAGATLALAACLARADAQELRINGHVVLETTGGARPLVATWVTLHRIGTAAGPVDSMPTDARGRYAFRVPRPDTGAIYLATSRYGGIAYFAPPVHVEDSLGAPGEIHVFDTTSAPVTIRHIGRHVVVGAPDAGGQREVVEVWELANDGLSTRLSSTASPAFAVDLPRAARAVRSTQGDFAGSGVSIEGTRVRVVAPFAPGIRQLVVTYALAPASFPLEVRLPDSTGVVEVLVEEPGATVRGAGLQALGAVSSEGRNFLRFLGNDIRAGTLAIDVPGRAAAGSSWPWMLGLGLASLVAIVWAFGSRRSVPALGVDTRRNPGERETLETTLAALELQLAGPGIEPADRRRLEEHARSLREALAAMAAGGPPG